MIGVVLMLGVWTVVGGLEMLMVRIIAVGSGHYIFKTNQNNDGFLAYELTRRVS